MILSMLWNSLVCFDRPSFKSLLWKVYSLKPDNWTFDFIKNLAQIINNFSKFGKTKKLIFAKMVKYYDIWFIWYGKQILKFRRWLKGFKYKSAKSTFIWVKRMTNWPVLFCLHTNIK
jgi:hypothetical protein